MFRFHKPQNVVTLFHRASSPSSVRVLALLKQANAAAVSGATEDQASDHSHQSKDHQQHSEFKLDVVEEAPTSDQMRSIFEYLGTTKKAEAVVKGAAGVDDALAIFKKSAEAFQRPLTVDWNNGKAVAGDNESEILAMLKDLPKDGSS